MSQLRDWEHIDHQIKQGHHFKDRFRDYRLPIRDAIKERARPSDIYAGQKYVRCPTCGGKVILPCLLCSLTEECHV